MSDAFKWLADIEHICKSGSTRQEMIWRSKEKELKTYSGDTPFRDATENRSNTKYASLFAEELEKLLANNKIRASCQTNMSPKHYSKRCKQRTLKTC